MNNTLTETKNYFITFWNPFNNIWDSEKHVKSFNHSNAVEKYIENNFERGGYNIRKIYSNLDERLFMVNYPKKNCLGYCLKVKEITDESI